MLGLLRGDSNSSKYWEGVGSASLLGSMLGLAIGAVVDIQGANDRADEAARKQQKAAEANRQREAEERKRKEEERKRKEEERLKEKALLNKLRQIHSLYNNSRPLLLQASKHLDQAEIEFQERVFAPFWDQVEHATNNLAVYHSMISEMNQEVASYQRAVGELPMRMPPVGLAIGELPSTEEVASRLYNIVRRAQSDHQFADIYEMRKANKILSAGFKSLETAIYSVGEHLHSELSLLSEVVEHGLSEIVNRIEDQSTMNNELCEEHRTFVEEMFKSSATERTKHHENLLAKLDEQSQMLDNIQRRRKPK